MAHFAQPRLQRPSHFNFATDVVDYWAAQRPAHRAMLWVAPDGQTTRELDYGHFSRTSHRAARVLQGLGIGKGDRVLIILPRVPAWWEIAVACLRARVVICPATTLLVDKDIEFRAQRARATAFVGDAASVGKFLKVRASCPSVKTVVQVDAGGDEDKRVQEGVVSYEEKMRDVPEDAVFEAQEKTQAEDPAVIYFTSGTSGPPKMVLHNAISYPLASTITGKHWLRLQPGKVFWNLSDQGWAKAAWSFFGTWNCGATIFIFDDRQPFAASRIFDMLHAFPITTLCAPPTAYRQMILASSQRLFKAKPPSALEHCTGAGEPLNDEVIKVWKRMSGIEICDGYGQSETILICGNFANQPVRPGSMGKPTPGVPLLVLDQETGEEAEVGKEGDIVLMIDHRKGEDVFFGLFEGYLNEEFKAVRKTRSYEDGKKEYYLTGDRATRDSDGYVWFVGRSDDVINSAGYRIGPFEVESTLKQHAAVVESAVVSSPDEARGEVVKAFIVLTDEYADHDSDKLVQELQDFCKQHAAPYKYPRKIQFVDNTFLPKTISGKIKRNELKKAEWAKEKPSAKL